MRVLCTSLATIILLRGVGLAQADPHRIRNDKTRASSPSDTEEVKASRPVSQRDEVPVTQLLFTPSEKPIPGASGSSAFATPILCSQEGVPFVPFVQPSDFGVKSVTSLDMEGGHLYSVNHIPGLYDTGVIKSYFVSDSEVGILVNATTSDAEAPNTVPIGQGLPPRHIFTGDHHDYLALFARDGMYKKYIELPKRYKFWRVALLPDGNLIGLTYDQPNSAPGLFLLDSDGNILRPVQVPASLSNSPEVLSGQQGDVTARVSANTSMSWWLFTQARGRVLLYRAHSRLPVVEIGSGGSVRNVSIRTPANFDIDSLISANDRWIVRFKMQGPPENAQASKDGSLDYSMFEIDPSDGSLKRELKMDSGPFFSIACEKDGRLSAFAVDGDKVKLMKADLSH